MSDFSRYVLLNELTAVEYAQQKTDLFELGIPVECKEIGDGNLNFVYRLAQNETKSSAILKQSGTHARATPDYALTTDRNRIESEILMWQAELAKGFVPRVYCHDTVMCCCVMEDLSDHKIMRGELLLKKTFPQFAEHISSFLVDTLIGSSDIMLEQTEKKKRVERFINPELCKISEELVFTDPFINAGGTNDVFAPVESWVQAQIYADTELRLEAAKLKYCFMTNAQSLLHGDLHTGSIFIKADSTKVIDPEFAFFGPAGYDVGNVIGNLALAWASEASLAETDETGFLQWILESVTATVDLFAGKARTLIAMKAVEPMSRSCGFTEWYVSEIVKDAAGFAGLEMIRRVVGEAHVADITSIKDERRRARAEILALTAGKWLVMNRNSILSGKDVTDMLRDVGQSL